MEPHVFNFTKNWNNKFNCDVFTTIRPFNESFIEDDDCKIYVAGKFLFNAKIIVVYSLSRLRDFPGSILLTDTGTFSKIEALELFAKIYNDPDIINMPFSSITLKKQ